MSSGRYGTLVDIFSLGKDIHTLLGKLGVDPEPALLAVLNRMISAEPNDRPASAKELKSIANGRIESRHQDSPRLHSAFYKVADLYLKAETDVIALERQLAVARGRRDDHHKELQMSFKGVYAELDTSDRLFFIRRRVN